MRRFSVLGTLVAAGWLVAGCPQKDDASSAGAAASGAPSGAAPSASANAGDAGGAPKAHARFGRHAGVASSLFRMADQLSLPQDEQASLDAIEANLRTDDAAVRAAMKGFRADLVSGVRSGRLDTAKLTADDATIDKAIADHQAKEAEALDALHTLLTPLQRTSLVGVVRERQTEREAHASSWLHPDGGAADWNKRRLDRLTTDLALDPAQQKQAAAVLGKPVAPPSGAALQTRMDERKKRYDALLTAFVGDTFDAKSLDLAVMPGKTTHEPMDRMVDFFSSFLPILHPDQRDKLATSIDRPFGAMGRPMPGSPPGARTPVDDFAFPFSEPSEGTPDDPAPAR